jgi:small subunit ribosomal protein S6
VYFNVEASPEAIIELERKMKIREDILRYLTVRIDAIDEEPSIVMQTKLKDEARKENRDKDTNTRTSKEVA